MSLAHASAAATDVPDSQIESTSPIAMALAASTSCPV
jgi:hypothetical protein